MSKPKPIRSRRRALKSLAGTGAVASAGLMLPERWTRPVVESAVLPAHAQGSVALNGNFQVMVGLNINVADARDASGGLLGFLVPAAHAGNGGDDEVTICLDVGGSQADIKISSCLGNGSDTASLPFDIAISLVGPIADTAQVTGTYDPVEDAVIGQVTLSHSACADIFALAEYRATRGEGPCPSPSPKTKKCNNKYGCKKKVATVTPGRKTQKKIAKAGGQLKASRKRRAKV